MKRILIIEDGRPFWPRIRDMLAKVNAVVVDAPAEGPPALQAERPDLVIIGDTGQAARGTRWWSGALLVLEKGRDSALVTKIGTDEKQVAASSSISERVFLTLTSRLLGVSERRLFRAVIGVRRDRRSHVHMGASREFSLTGLSFALPVDLESGERIRISFYVPNARRRFEFEAEVVRAFSDPEDGAGCYGARFVGLTAEERDALKRFVWAEE